MGNKTKDGASGINYKDICPICGKERTKDCKNTDELVLCPNKAKCGNNNKETYNGKKEYVRAGCTGYLCGNVGIGTFLGSNIMIHTYGSTKPKPRPPSNKARKESLENYEDKIKKSNEQIIAAFKEAEAYEVAANHQEGFDKELEKFRNLDNKLYKYNGHPLFVFGGGIQAHHLICTETMKNDKWRAICKDTGYNINCYKNGIFLPSFINLACHLGYPRHFGGHSLGRGDEIAAGGAYKSYVDSVKKEINNISNAFNKRVCGKATTKEFIDEINEVSVTICNYIKIFDWTITWDGLNYKKGIDPRIGCAGLTGLDSLGMKKDKLVKNCRGELMEKKMIYVSKGKKSLGELKWRKSNNDMKTINKLKGIGNVCCKRDHSEDFTKDERKNFLKFSFSVGH